MRKLFVSSVVLALLGGPALAQQQIIVQDSGPSAGPVVAVVPAPSVRRYIVDNPRPPVVIEGRLSQGSVVPMDVELVPVPENPEFVYFYDGDNRPVVVRAQDRQVVYVDEDGVPIDQESTVVPDRMPDELIGYVRDNPVDPVMIEGDIDIGYEVPDDAALQPVAGYDGYSYFYRDGRPYVVNTAERRVVYYAR